MTSKENMLNLRQIKLNKTELIKEGGGVVGWGGGEGVL